MSPARLCAVAGALAIAASAATPSAARTELSSEKARAAMHAYAKCVVKRQGRKASEALLSNADNVTILREYESLIDGECLEFQVAKISFGGDLFRYALADALVNRELADRPVPDLTNVPRLAHRTQAAPPAPLSDDAGKSAREKFKKAEEDYAEAVAIGFLSSYGECIVRHDPAGAKALLLTVPDSPQERGGFDVLRPAFAACLVEGRTLRFGRVALRGSIAINYYRLAHAARASVPSDAEAWASCIWTTAPRTAARWLESLPGYGDAGDNRANLEIRVRSVCGRILREREFEPEAVRAALSRTRPADPGGDAPGVAGYVCEYRTRGVVTSTWRWGGHPDTPNAPGSTVLAEPLGERECREITADGSLVPMRPYSGKDDA